MLDEPDAYLDALSRATLERQLVQNTRNGSMVLISTHDPDMAVRLARRLFAIEEGTLHELSLVDGPKAIIDLLTGDAGEELSV